MVSCGSNLYFGSLNPVTFKSSFDEAIRIGRAPKGSKVLRQIFNALPFGLGNKLNRAGIALLIKNA